MNSQEQQRKTRIAFSGLTPLLSLLFLSFCSLVKAQHLEFEWSEERQYSNRKEGFFSDFINTGESNLYVLQSNMEGTRPYKNTRLKLAAYNKYTLALIAERPLKGFKENKAQKPQLDSLDYVSTQVQSSKVYVFWRKLHTTDSSRKEDLYVQTFKEDLEPDLPITKVYSTYQAVEAHPSIFSKSAFIFLSDRENDLLLIGTEHCSEKGVEFIYTSLSPRLTVSGEKKVVLPQRVDSLSQGTTASYDLRSDGCLYIRSSKYYTADELDEMNFRSSKTYLVVTVVKVATGESVQIPLRGQDKTITDFNLALGAGKTRVLGFFGDLEKDPTGIDKQGIFYADINTDSLAETSVQYSYFEKTTLNRLFPRSRGGRRKNVDVPTPEELKATRFDIENVVSMEDGSAILFFTRKYNYTEITSRSGMDGNNIYKSTDYCEKNNVSAIRFTPDGKVLWTSNLERNKTYLGNDVVDLHVISRFDKIFVIYGNDLLAKGQQPKKKVVEEEQLRVEFSYAIFDPVTGRAKPYLMPVNEPKTEEKYWKYIDPNSAVVFDDQVYFEKMAVKQNPLWIAANIAFFPSLYYTFLTGNTKVGKGDITVAAIIEGRKKKR